MAFNNQPAWDNSTLNDDSLFALLQKHATNPSSLVLDPTRFPAPPADNPTPPASEDSSPSPPSLREKEQFARSRYEDENSKRKAVDLSDSDSDDVSPRQSKAQHRGDGHSKKSGSRKKSGGATDESRLLKRKEQNRAAQRAFRERKEKHVKELEDQVAVLEGKTRNQDRENENLRDLLGRLQNENLLLKQSAFTFSFPSGSAKSPSASGATPAAKASSPKLPSPSSSSSASSPENSQEPTVYSSLFAGPSTTTTVEGSSSASSSSSPRSEANTSRFQSSPADFNLTTLPDFGGIDFSNNAVPEANNGGTRKPQYTTIVSNPMYTSYQDPVLDPMAWASFGPADYSQGDVDMNIWGGVQPYANNGAMNASVTSIDELFNNQNSYMDYNSYSNNNFSSPSSGLQSTGASPSPITQLSPTNGGAPAPAVEGAEEQHGEGCPRTVEDVNRIISSNSPSTFGPPIPVKSPSPPSMPRREADEKDACAHARMAALCADLPRTSKKPNQIEIGRAWEKVRQHPNFEECDIDELCNELSAKARCDGSRPVLEESSFNDIVQSLPGMYKR